MYARRPSLSFVLSVDGILRLWVGTGLEIAPGVSLRVGRPNGVASALSIVQSGVAAVAFTRIEAVLARVGAKAMGPTQLPTRVEGCLVHWPLFRGNRSGGDVGLSWLRGLFSAGVASTRWLFSFLKWAILSVSRQACVPSQTLLFPRRHYLWRF
jgi:hypothetical protein